MSSACSKLILSPIPLFLSLFFFFLVFYKEKKNEITHACGSFSLLNILT
jgi:hypothetical protein